MRTIALQTFLHFSLLYGICLAGARFLVEQFPIGSLLCFSHFSEEFLLSSLDSQGICRRQLRFCLSISEYDRRRLHPLLREATRFEAGSCKLAPRGTFISCSILVARLRIESTKKRQSHFEPALIPFGQS